MPDGFVDEPVVTGLTGELIAFDQSSSGSFYLAEKSGLVRIWRDDQLLDEPFLDIREKVNDRVDRGLLGLALHPQFPDVPYVYLAYTFDPPELIALEQEDPGRFDGNGNRVARVVRYTADSQHNHERAVPDSEVILIGKNSTYENIGDPEGNPNDLENIQLPSCGPVGAPLNDCLPIDEITHTVGSLRFAPDGTLLATNGDGASYLQTSEVAFMVQDLDSLRGKILRIDPISGLGLSDNPFFDGDPNSNRSKVLSYGLRNPFSLAIHPRTGEPYVGDVGWDLWEDVHGGSGRNFGWPCFEGNNTGNLRREGFSDEPYCMDFYARNPDISRPIDSWLRGETGAAMVGDFYTGTQFPEIWQGKLFYFDFLQGWMRAIDVDSGNPSGRINFASEVPPITHVDSSPDGALYYASVSVGEIRRIRYALPLNTDTETGSETEGNSPTMESSGGGSLSAWGWLSLAMLLVCRLHHRALPSGNDCLQ